MKGRGGTAENGDGRENVVVEDVGCEGLLLREETWLLKVVVVVVATAGRLNDAVGLLKEVDGLLNDVDGKLLKDVVGLLNCKLLNC